MTKYIKNTLKTGACYFKPGTLYKLTRKNCHDIESLQYFCHKFIFYETNLKFIPDVVTGYYTTYGHILMHIKDNIFLLRKNLVYMEPEIENIVYSDYFIEL